MTPLDYRPWISRMLTGIANMTMAITLPVGLLTAGYGVLKMLFSWSLSGGVSILAGLSIMFAGATVHHICTGLSSWRHARWNYRLFNKGEEPFKHSHSGWLVSAAVWLVMALIFVALHQAAQPSSVTEATSCFEDVVRTTKTAHVADQIPQ